MAICSISSLRGKVSGPFSDTLDEARRFLRAPRESPARTGTRAIVGARHGCAGPKNLGGVAADRRHAGRSLSARAKNHGRSRRCAAALSPGAVLSGACRLAVTKIAGAGRRRHQSMLARSPACIALFSIRRARIKRAFSSPRRSLGAILGNGVRFGKIDDVVIIGEGIETVLSLKSALPDFQWSQRSPPRILRRGVHRRDCGGSSLLPIMTSQVSPLRANSRST